MIDPRLQTLRVLRERGTVTATAYALHLTPSTVSQQLKQLAKETGSPLLAAEGRRVRLTPQAEILLDHADVMFQQWERARGDLAAHSRGDIGRLRMCGISSALAEVIAPAAARLRKEHPGLTTRLSAAESQDCFGLLLSGEIDIAVVVPTKDTPAANDPRFEQQALMEDRLELMVAADHAWAERPSVTLAEASTQEWVAMPSCVDQHQLMMSSAAAAGFTPSIRHEANDWASAAALVSHGFGVSLMTAMVPLPDEHRVARVPITGHPTPSRRLFACVRRGSRQQAGIEFGLNALRTAAAELA